MPRRPGDTNPEPPGGRAAERRRALLAGRFPNSPADVETSDEEELETSEERKGMTANDQEQSDSADHRDS